MNRCLDIQINKRYFAACLNQDVPLQGSKDASAGAYTGLFNSFQRGDRCAEERFFSISQRSVFVRLSIGMAVEIDLAKLVQHLCVWPAGHDGPLGRNRLPGT